MSNPSVAVSSSRAGLRAWEWVVLVVQPLILVAVAAWSQTTQPEAFRLLWTEATGRSMLILAVVLLAADAVLLAFGFSLLKRLFRERPPLRLALTGFLHVGCFVVLFLPSVWVLAIGPSALQIARNVAM
jgi:hypothetical protein